MADNCGMHLINQELSGLSKGVDCITNFAHKKLFHSVVEKWKKKLRESYQYAYGVAGFQQDTCTNNML